MTYDEILYDNNQPLIITKYGALTNEQFNEHMSNLASRIWKLIPLKDEECFTINKYIERLNRELYGLINVLEVNGSKVFSIICLLENLITEQNFEAYRSDVFRCCSLIDKLKIKEV